MRLSISKSTLQAAIKTAVLGVDKKAKRPDLTRLCLQAGKDREPALIGTDLERSVLIRVPAHVEKVGIGMVDPIALQALLKIIPDEEIVLHGDPQSNHLFLNNLPLHDPNGISPMGFPFPAIDPLPLLPIPGDVFRKVLDQTAFCMSRDSGQYHINGILIEHNNSTLRFVATDGHRMSIVDIPFPESEVWLETCEPDFNQGAIIPKKTVEVLQKICKKEPLVRIGRTEDQFICKFSTGTVVSGFLEGGEFPPYRAIVPESLDFSFRIQKKPLQEAIQRIFALVGIGKPTSLDKDIIRFSFSKDFLALSSVSQEFSWIEPVTLPIHSKNPVEETIGFNGFFVLDFLESVDSPEIEISCKIFDEACQFSPTSDPSYRHFLMPVRLQTREAT